MARILLIEDNRDHLELMAYLLRSQGHIPLSAGSADSAQMMLKCCEQIDLIICDIHLGPVNGIDLVRALRKSGRFPEIPIVAVTAGSIGQAHEAFAAGCDHYILKPIEPETFVQEVTSRLALGRRSDDSGGKPVPPRLTGQQNTTILAVDDRSANLDLFNALLSPLAYRVITARGVKEALDRARGDHPDLILTDVHMGDGSGFDLIRELRADAALRKIPWLVTSATYLAMDVRAQEIGLDETNFILQPWEPEILLARIRERMVPPARGAQGKSVGAN